jgi:hypothetical protein
MLNRKARILAVTALAIVPATALVGLSATGASAATTTAATASHVTAQRPAAASGCVAETFGESNVYQSCVDDLQVLLNDLRYVHAAGPNQLLATDGYYGPDTASDVAAFNHVWGQPGGSDMTPRGWYDLCYEDNAWGYHGAYWHGAGCASII